MDPSVFWTNEKLDEPVLLAEKKSTRTTNLQKPRVVLDNIVMKSNRWVLYGIIGCLAYLSYMHHTVHDDQCYYNLNDGNAMGRVKMINAEPFINKHCYAFGSTYTIHDKYGVLKADNTNSADVTVRNGDQVIYQNPRFAEYYVLLAMAGSFLLIDIWWKLRSTNTLRILDDLQGAIELNRTNLALAKKEDRTLSCYQELATLYKGLFDLTGQFWIYEFIFELFSLFITLVVFPSSFYFTHYRLGVNLFAIGLSDLFPHKGVCKFFSYSQVYNQPLANYVDTIVSDTYLCDLERNAIKETVFVVLAVLFVFLLVIHSISFMHKILFITFSYYREFTMPIDSAALIVEKASDLLNRPTDLYMIKYISLVFKKADQRDVIVAYLKHLDNKNLLSKKKTISKFKKSDLDRQDNRDQEARIVNFDDL